MARIGLLRALEYHRFGLLWEGLLQRLDVEVVLSPETTRQTLESGVRQSMAKLCLPLKVFYGHLAALGSQVEVLFIPVITAISPETTRCARLLGLAEMTRTLVPEAPPTVVARMDLSRRRLKIRWPDPEAKARLRWSTKAVKAAWEEALTAWENQFATAPSFSAPQPRERPCIGVISHMYHLADAYTNHRLPERLTGMGVDLLTPAQVPPPARREGLEALAEKPYWGCDEELIGTAGYCLQAGVDGLIVVTAFGCGPDATLVMTIQRAAGERGVPCLVLTLDEHSGAAGLITRLEAFVDMLERRQINANLSRPGRGLGEYEAGSAL